MKFPDSRILIFCKAPVAGKVKTRLQPELSAQEAAEVHIKLTLKTIALVTESQLCPVELWCHPDTHHDFFIECQEKFPVSCHVQEGADLGERMSHALSVTLNNRPSAILIGSDCPSLTASDFTVAFEKLEQGSDVVIAPTEDGGYALIGLRKTQAAIFQRIHWGISSVFKETHKKIEQQKLTCFELPEQWDVDRHEDYQRYLSL